MTTGTPGANTVHLGYEVGSGDRVHIPIAHMAVVGQTQAAGKTTALEALAARLPDAYAILAFTTKRGEGSFTNGVVAVPPFFRERADWEYVSAILEATLRERMKFERSWIMRASKGATTLADVKRNVHTLMKSAKGLSADVYYQLDMYLAKIVPQVQALGSPKELKLSRTTGPNVMDLTPFTLEMQGLIIASCLDQIYQSMVKTIVVIPEAWEFLPRSRRSPVTVAAEAFVRKGAALRNYLWIDSQDLSGVHTPVLKQVGVWLLGVQREINEARRTIAHVHTQQKPRVEAVAGLGLGQFIACFGGEAIKTYVQPAWMTTQRALQNAQGISETQPKFEQPVRAERIDPMDQQLKDENDRLRTQVTELQERVRMLSTAVDVQRRAGTTPLHGRPLDDNGKIEFQPPRVLASGEPAAPAEHSPESRDDLYAWFVHRLITDQRMIEPLVMRVIAEKPQIIVELKTNEVSIDGATPRGRLARMIADGIADQPIKPGVIVKEFARTGNQIHPSNLSRLLDEFVVSRVLTRDDGGTYVKAPGVVITQKGVVAQ